MSVVWRITFFTCVFFFISSISSVPVPDKESKNEKLSDEKPNEKGSGTVSPKTLKTLEKEITEYQKENSEKFDWNLTSKPKEVDQFLEEEEKEYGKELPDKMEELITESDVEIKNFNNFLALFNKIKQESAKYELEDDEEADKKVVKTPAQMKEMKEETFRLVNEANKKHGRPEVSREEFDKEWDIKKEESGERFPAMIERFLKVAKTAEDEKGSTTVETITLEASEAATMGSTESSDAVKEESPKGAFTLRDAKGKICILAKFQSTIVITYPGKSSQQKVEVTIPHNSYTKGKCRGPNGSALLQITWGKFIFSLTFNKTTEEEWGVTLVELVYDTSEPLFDGTAERTKITAKNKKASLFETPFGKSYSCAGQEVILLYKEDVHVATVRLSEIHLQPYDVEDGKFSESHHCNQVVLGDPDEEPFVQDETVPLAVGCTLALITLLILVGFSVHRAYNAAKVDYNTVE